MEVRQGRRSALREWFDLTQKHLNVELADRAGRMVLDTKHLVYREWNIRNYLRTAQVRKLQIGCGTNILDGWLNTDLMPFDRRVAYLDATRPFPLPDNSFDFVFSEHNIEHLSFEDGQFMLREAFRVLRPGGYLRIVQPDLARLLAIYDRSLDTEQKRYVEFMKETFIPDGMDCDDVQVINLAMRFSGHKFLYDKRLFESCLKDAGFVDIIGTEPGPAASQHEAFKSADSHGDFIGDENVNRYESFATEARKP